MYIKSIIIIVLLVAVLGILVAGCAKHRFSHKSPDEKAQWLSEKISSELDLDDMQNAKLNQIKSEILARYKQQGDFKTDIWNTFNTQIKGDSIDRQKLNETFASKEKQFSEMRVLMVDKFAEFYAVLTAEQRSDLASKIGKMHRRWKH